MGSGEPRSLASTPAGNRFPSGGEVIGSETSACGVIPGVSILSESVTSTGAASPADGKGAGACVGDSGTSVPAPPPAWRVLCADNVAWPSAVSSLTARDAVTASWNCRLAVGTAGSRLAVAVVVPDTPRPVSSCSAASAISASAVTGTAALPGLETSMSAEVVRRSTVGKVRSSRRSNAGCARWRTPEHRCTLAPWCSIVVSSLCTGAPQRPGPQESQFSLERSPQLSFNTCSRNATSSSSDSKRSV